MSRHKFFLCLLLIHLKVAAQPTPWPLVFSQEPLCHANPIRKNIDTVMEIYLLLDTNLNVKRTSIEEKEYVVDVYTFHHRVLAIHRYTGWAFNGTRTLLFDSLGHIRLIFDHGHGMSWFVSRYAFIDCPNTWVFTENSDEIVIGDDHMGHYPGSSRPLWERLWLAQRSEIEFDMNEERRLARYYLSQIKP